MKTLILGASGQLGSDLTPLSPKAILLGRSDVDVTDLAALLMVLDQHQPERIINCTAYNLVDKAEQEPEVAFRANALVPRELAKWCEARSAELVHISTDYVYGLDCSRKTPYREEEAPGPLCAYGLSKLAGEYFVRSHCPQHYIIRSCGLYGLAATKSKGNFVKTMLRLGLQKPELRVVNDQHCTPTSTADLAQGIDALLRTSQYGLYHITNFGTASWYDVASVALNAAGIATPVLPISTAEFGALAARPAYSVLDCSKFSEITGLTLRPWEEAVKDYVRMLT